MNYFEQKNQIKNLVFKEVEEIYKKDMSMREKAVKSNEILEEYEKAEKAQIFVDKEALENVQNLIKVNKISLYVCDWKDQLVLLNAISLGANREQSSRWKSSISSLSELCEKRINLTKQYIQKIKEINCPNRAQKEAINMLEDYIRKSNIDYYSNLFTEFVTSPFVIIAGVSYLIWKYYF